MNRPRSCGCFTCRHASKARRQHVRHVAERKLRHAYRVALRRHDDVDNIIVRCERAG